MLANVAMAIMAETNIASDHSLLWGRALAFWDHLGIWSLIIGAGLGVAALLLTAASAYILYRVADEAQLALGAETKRATTQIAEATERTEKLRAQNLELETAIAPRILEQGQTGGQLKI